MLERKQLTSGTTWHAAGLIAQLRATKNMTKLAKYSQELYGTLEEETGVATGFKRCGSITVALTTERLEEIFRQAAMARSFGVEVEEIDSDRVKELYPHINLEGIKGAVYLPKDGQGDPGNIALALAKGARQRGALIKERIKVTNISSKTDVLLPGSIGKPTMVMRVAISRPTWWSTVVACGATKLAKWLMSACRYRHANIFTLSPRTSKGMTQCRCCGCRMNMPITKKTQEKSCWGPLNRLLNLGPLTVSQRILSLTSCPRISIISNLFLNWLLNGCPLLAEAGIHTFFNGPESFTPDDAYHLGLAPELNNFWVAAGFNSIGIQSAGGAGMALAEWMDTGEKPFDLGDVDINRMQPFQGNKKYLFERSKETLGLLYKDHFPFKQKETARGIRRSPFHHQLQERGAVFGELAGWERANWFAREGQEAEYQYSWKRQNFFDNLRTEHMAIRQNVGMYDMSSFGKTSGRRA